MYNINFFINMVLIMNDTKLIDFIFPNPLPTVDELEARFPIRDLPEGAKVMRVAPSPTGYMHIGTLYTGLICERAAHQSGGVFMLRIEDTDKKREVEGAVELIVKAFQDYEIKVDEGATSTTTEQGSYGPYTQSLRGEIYQACAKYLVEEGLAYPCFCTDEDRENLHKQQEASGALKTGYYGEWAKCRHLTPEQIAENIAAGKPYTIRYKSPGNPNKTIVVQDVLRGHIEFPEYTLDVVLLKENGIPTYHFAHVVDDHFMRTTIVSRGDEWLSSYPLHVQLFRSMGWKAPKFMHIAPIQKLDEGNRRKISKRKDPEATVTYYEEVGYPKQAPLEYMMNLANSNFEDWRRQNPTTDYREFPFSIKKLNNSGALFDFVKLNNISKEIIAKMDANQLYENGLVWAEKFDTELADLMKSNKEQSIRILDIERGGREKVRKDIVLYADLRAEMMFFFDDKFSLTKDEALSMLENITPSDITAIVADFQASYNPNDTKEEWFAKLQETGAKFGFAKNGKELKANPEAFKGDVSMVAKIFRVLLVGRPQTADLYSIMQVMGQEKMFTRINLVK